MKSCTPWRSNNFMPRCPSVNSVWWRCCIWGMWLGRMELNSTRRIFVPSEIGLCLGTWWSCEFFWKYSPIIGDLWGDSLSWRHPLNKRWKNCYLIGKIKCSRLFECLKVVMRTCWVLVLLCFSHSFVLECDASSEGIEALLMQEGHPIA